MLLHEDALAFTIDDITIRVDQVTFLVYSASNIVDKDVRCSTALQHDVAICILVEDTDDIFNIKSLAAIIKQFLNVTVIQLLSVELLATVLVHDVTIASLDEPAESVDTAALLVHIEALFCLQ